MIMNRRKRAIILIMLRRRMKERQEKKYKRFWVRDIFLNRQETGAYHRLFQELKNDQEKFFNFVRMSTEGFSYIHNLVKLRLERCYVCRQPIGSEERLALTLRYLASGDSMVSMSYLFRISTASVSLIIRETCDVLWDVLSPVVFTETSVDVWKRIAFEFEHRWNFPNCCGAVDGKHIIMQAPPGAGSQFFNFKKDHSIVLMAICDANYKFISVDIGAYGRQSDSGVFNNSAIGQQILNNSIEFPQPHKPRNGGPTLPHVFVGDEAFPLRENFMRPYPGGGTRVLPTKLKIFNYRLSRARRIVENAFGILSARWRILRKHIIGNVETVESITKATVCLHNLLQTRERSKYCPPNYVDIESKGGLLIAGEWREDNFELPGIAKTHERNFTQTARNIREKYADYFLEEGAVHWQLESINKTG